MSNLPLSPLIGSSSGGASAYISPAPVLAAYLQAEAPLASTDNCAACTQEVALDSPGYTLPLCYLDVVFADDGLTLLARQGQKLASFKGTGSVYVEDGVARLVDAVPSHVTSLWHHFITLNGMVVPDEPKPAPFLAVSDDCGGVHAVGGPQTGFSFMVHNKALGGWNVMLAGKAPKDHIGRLPETTVLQLTGYQPLSPQGDGQETRDLKALGEAGLIYNEDMQAPPSTTGDCCEGTTQTVAKALPYPTGEGEYVLCYEDGVLSWQLKTASTSCSCCCTSLPQNLLNG